MSAFAEWPVLILRREGGGELSVTGPAEARFGSRCDDGRMCPTDPFCEWTWDGSRLVALTDRYGFAPLFYHAWNDGIMVSPSIDALIRAGAPTTIDAGAVAVLLRLGFLVGEDTAFAKIRILPAGGKLTWTSTDALRIEKNHVFGHESSISRSAAVDEYIDRFRVAVQRRAANGAAVVPLSGGRDSRHIFLELCASGRAPDVAVTVGGWGGQSTGDIEVARALAARAGVRHLVLPLPPSRWDVQMQILSATHFSTLEHWWLEPLVRYLRDFGSDVTLYEGVAGDVLSTSVLTAPEQQVLYEAGKFEELARMLVGKEGYLPSILPPEWYARTSREAAIERIAHELAVHSNAPSPLASFYVYNRTRRVTSLPPASLFGPYATVWCPYLDAELWDFLSSLPPQLLQGESVFSFHDAAIQRAYPGFSDIPFAPKYYTRPRMPTYDRSTVTEMGLHVARKRPALVRRRFLYPRLVRGLLDPSFTAQAADLSPLVSFLTELSLRDDLLS